MEIKEIMENLKNYNNGKFPKESILEAKKYKKEITEELLKELEEVSNNIEKYAEDEENMLVLYSLYLLAEFREKRAFPVIIKIITNENQEDVDCLLGDVITEDLNNILASVYDGNIDALYNIIVNSNLYRYIRSAAFDTLVVLQANNIISENEVISLIERMLENELKEDESIVITDIVAYIAENKLYDKIELVKELYRDDRVDELMIGWYDDFIDDIYGDKKSYNDRAFISNTEERLSNWACFENEEENDEYDYDILEEKLKESMEESKNLTNELSDIQNNLIKVTGRNDLCFCGSGKKYKKCCMNKMEGIVVTPADTYIQKTLSNYPKETLEKFYDKDIIEIDEKLYKVLKDKAIPMWIDRNYVEENRRNTRNMDDALELIKKKCEKENIKTQEEFDKKMCIHYTLENIFIQYTRVIRSDSILSDREKEEYRVKFLEKMVRIIDLEEGYLNALILAMFFDVPDYRIDKIKERINRVIKQKV